MIFAPREALFSVTGKCNLSCPHCSEVPSANVLPRKAALKFLSDCKRSGVERVGFTGGEPFLAPKLLYALTKRAVKEGLFFNRIMTNGVWYRNGAHLKRVLTGLRDAGYDGSICVSVDAFHAQDMKKVARFVKEAVRIWGRPDIISAAAVTGAKDARTRRKLKALGRVKVLKIELSPLGKARALKNPWGKRWFKDDYCRGPGNVFFVTAAGDVKPCCGYATDSKMLTIGNIKRDSAPDMVKNAKKNRFISDVFGMGLGYIRKRLEDRGIKFPGKTENHCFFCGYILKHFPAKLLALALIFLFAAASLSEAETQKLRTAKEFKKIPFKVVKEIKLPKGYREGLFYNDSEMWVANGKKGNIWVVDIASGGIRSQIKPAGNFTEGITKASDGEFLVTDWEGKNIYRARLEGKRLVSVGEASVAPSHPAGIVWNGKSLFVVTWKRGFGTKFYLLEMDKDMNLIRKIRVPNIQEPTHLAWDGNYLWIASWYSRRIYKVDVNRLEVAGYIPSPAAFATGVAWDGKYLWVIGTYSNLFKLEIAEEGGGIMKMTSAAFTDGGMMPAKYGAGKENVSPPLEWSGVPAGTKSLALICDDPDAPGGDWVHWVVFNMPPDSNGLKEGTPKLETLPDGSNQGANDSSGSGYDGPWPPSGTHRYFFKLYALDTMLDLKAGATKKQVLAVMQGHILAEAQIMGRYKR